MENNWSSYIFLIFLWIFWDNYNVGFHSLFFLRNFILMASVEESYQIT